MIEIFEPGIIIMLAVAVCAYFTHAADRTPHAPNEGREG